MSYYYNYYLGYKKDNKIYPYAPYDSKGKLACVLSRSRSFASDLYMDFRELEDDKVSDELINSLITDSFKKNYEESQKTKKTLREAFLEDMCFKYLPLTALPTGNFIKEGYVLFNAVDNEDNDYWPCLNPHVYAEKIKSGKDEVYDDEGEVMYRVSDLIYHKWIDTQSKEYEASIISNAYETFWEYGIPNEEIVVIETEG